MKKSNTSSKISKRKINEVIIFAELLETRRLVKELTELVILYTHLRARMEHVRPKAPVKKTKKLPAKKSYTGIKAKGA